MATKKTRINYTVTAATVYAIVERQADNYLMNDADGTFSAAPADPYKACTEHTTLKGQYVFSEARQTWSDGSYVITFYAQAGGSPSPVADQILGSEEMIIYSDAVIVSPTLAQIEGSSILAKESTVSARPTLAQIEGSTVIAKEVTVNTIKTYTDTLETAVAALQTDLGDPSVDTTSIYAQILSVKNYVDTVETSLGTVLKLFKNKDAFIVEGGVLKRVVYDNDGTTAILKKALKDSNGTDLSMPTGVVTQALASEV